jgi:hypothetical protein
MLPRAAAALTLCLTTLASAQCIELAGTFNNAVTGPVRAIQPWTPTAGSPANLVIGGDFTANLNSPETFPCDYVGYWDPVQTAWRGLGWGTNGSVRTLALWDPDGPGPLREHVIAAGAFTFVGADSTGAIPANNIARWDGAAWRALSSGLDGQVTALTTWDPDGPGPQPSLLVAGGSFRHAGGAVADYIAAWNGTQWRGLGWGFDAPVHCLTPWDPDGDGPRLPLLAAAGEFRLAGSNTTGEISSRSVSLWNGESWASTDFPYYLEGTATDARAIDFDGAGPEPARLTVISSQKLAKFDGTQWRSEGPRPVLPQNGADYNAMATMRVPGSPPRLWVSGSTWYGYWYSGPPFCLEVHCFRREYGPDRVWTGSGHPDDLAYTQSGFMVSALLSADVLEEWDADGDGALQPLMIAAARTAPFLRSYAVNPAPLILDQPTSGSARVGDRASFRVQLATGTGGPSYSWYKGVPYGNFIALTDGSGYTGTRTPFLSFNPVRTSHAVQNRPTNGEFYGLFKCVATVAAGAGTTALVSETARLDIAPCSADFNFDGDSGTDQDIEAFFACLAGNCCPTCASADFNGDGDTGTDQDIESFFRVLAGGAC